jgi:DNA-directed RNA polymerase specialized sigma24 family protein
LEDFFFGMCVKVAQELARKADRLRKLEGAERDVATPDDIPGPDPLGDAERPSEKLLAALQEAIEVLPEPLRAIIQADLDAGGTAPTGPLAAKLGINPATVRTRRYRGRHDLREFLEKRGFTGLFG